LNFRLNKLCLRLKFPAKTVIGNAYEKVRQKLTGQKIAQQNRFRRLSVALAYVIKTLCMSEKPAIGTFSQHDFSPFIRIAAASLFNH
jgi:hypothetical protein